MDRLTGYDLSEPDYSVARSIIEAQFNIRFRKKTKSEKVEDKNMMLKCPVCNTTWRSQGWDEPDSTIAQAYCCNECYNKANNSLRKEYEPMKSFRRESPDQRKVPENKVVEEKPNYDDPDFLELTGVCEDAELS